ncbi:MAG: 50S ribosomal protein L29 [Ardenticatenaceae bacterium]|nr:50S ribosomal protein L29 [Anaerolineales bacterium]MCB8922596.1 50S ribosomal protein L29 [Ardenticatenaceae bacterium]MCB8991264.1 50S ribosomal protein L29 [Ardenticatenaceae bacterium]MCB9003695.1 50S ribosomal protein L29 [Ardenticatenaceae bacterium]
MLNIVELREMSGDKLNEMLENAREELFNLRFQKASARLENYARLKHVKREIAQLETVLHARQVAKETAVSEPEIAQALTGKEWKATARFQYEDSAWRVQFVDGDGSEIAVAMVNLNKKHPQGRKARQSKQAPRLVTSYQIAG